MKTTVAIVALAFTGCMTETTRTITTDKAGTVTDVTTVKKGTDPAAMELLSVAREIYLPRHAVVVREEKAVHGREAKLVVFNQTAFRERQITREEIAKRWKP